MAKFITGGAAKAKPELIFQLAAPESFWQTMPFPQSKILVEPK